MRIPKPECSNCAFSGEAGQTLFCRFRRDPKDIENLVTQLLAQDPGAISLAKASILNNPCLAHRHGFTVTWDRMKSRDTRTHRSALTSEWK